MNTVSGLTTAASAHASPRHRARYRWVGALTAVALLLPPLAVRAAADPIADKRAQAARIAAQLAADGQRISILSEQLDGARLRADQLQQQLTQAEAALAQTAGQVTTQRSRLRQQAVDAYVRGGNVSMVQVMVQSSNSDLSVRNTYLSTVTSNERDAVDGLRQAQQDLAAQQAALRATQALARDAVTRAATAERSAAALDGTDRTLLASVQGQLAALVAEEQARQRAAEQARAQAAQAALAARLSRTGRGPNGTGGANVPPPNAGAAAAVDSARQQLGKPYQYGGAGPDSFDCSGLTAWAWRAGGVSLPHSSSAQYDATTHIPGSALQPGDLVFYGNPPYHVGIYVGGGQMINALHSGTNVEYDSIYVDSGLIGGGRVN